MKMQTKSHHDSFIKLKKKKEIHINKECCYAKGKRGKDNQKDDNRQ